MRQNEVEHEARGEFRFFDLFDDVGKQIFGDPDDCRNGATHQARNWGSPIPFAEEHGIV